MSMTGIIDLTISGGAQDLEEALPSGVALFQNPLLAYVYERGYRDVFDILNFPGYNEEVTCTLIVAIFCSLQPPHGLE
jgi:hypothetical protein